jgi:arylsulfatase A-like enzyme
MCPASICPATVSPAATPGTFARWAAGLALALFACVPRPPAPPPDILLISIDTLRRDHLSAYGYQRETSPRIDALAADGALFLNAVSTSNWTLPAHMSLMTGLPPSLHGVEDDGSRLPDTTLTLAQALRRAGYATGGVTSHLYVAEQFGFARGFDHFETRVDQRAESATDSAIRWLESVGKGPVFLFVHYFDPHTDYDPPEPFASRFGPADRALGDIDRLKYHWNPQEPFPADRIPELLRLYDGEIAYTDHHVGRLADWLAERGRLDDTIVAIVSDHGEDFGEHGTFGHGMHLHGEVTRVPLILRYPPRVAAGERRDLAVLYDLPATLLRLAGLAVPGQLELRAADLGTSREGAADRTAILESTRWGPKRFGVRQAQKVLLTRGTFSPIIVDDRERGSSLVRFGPIAIEPAIFDLTADAGERDNLLGGEGDREVAELTTPLVGYLESSERAARLSCVGGDAAGRYGVTLRVDGGLVDEPFCLDAAAAFALRGMESTFNPRGLAAVELDLSLEKAEAVTVFLPLGEDAGGLAVRLIAEGASPIEATVDVPAPGTAVDLPFPGSPGPSCVLSIPDLSLETGEAPDLSEEDLERLRALGYVG